MRTRLAGLELLEFYGSVIDGQDLLTMQQRISKVIPKVDPRVMQASLQHLLGVRFTPEVATITAWRLAANAFKLRRGEPARPWTTQMCREWVPVHVLDSLDTTTSKNEPAVQFTLLILAGSPAPMRVTKVWKRGFCRMLARHVGYTNRRGRFPFADPTELVNLRFKVLLEPGLTRDGRPGFEKLACTGQLKEWNQAILGKRARMLDGVPWPCPSGFDYRCYRCPIGYDRCEAGTHPQTFYATNNAGVADVNVVSGGAGTVLSDRPVGNVPS